MWNVLTSQLAQRCTGQLNIYTCKENEVQHKSYISTMPSGRLAGISVRPLRRQSTMLLLQLQLAGHTATCGTQVLDSVCTGPVDGEIQVHHTQHETLETFNRGWVSVKDMIVPLLLLNYWGNGKRLPHTVSGGRYKISPGHILT